VKVAADCLGLIFWAEYVGEGRRNGVGMVWRNSGRVGLERKVEVEKSSQQDRDVERVREESKREKRRERDR